MATAWCSNGWGWRQWCGEWDECLWGVSKTYNWSHSSTLSGIESTGPELVGAISIHAKPEYLRRAPMTEVQKIFVGSLFWCFCVPYAGRWWKAMSNRYPINWKGGLGALFFCCVFYALFIYFTFVNEPIDGWKGSLHNFRYPFAAIAPIVMAYGIFQKFREK